MKTKLFSLLLLILLTGKSFSQEYFPLLNNSKWIVDATDWGGTQTFSIYQGGDETVGLYTYKKFVDPSTQTYLLREDIASRKVFKIIGGNDVLLFDFSLNVSDNITLGNGENYQVTSISNINVNGGQRRQFVLENTSSPFGFDEVWIEGVGSSVYPLLANYELMSDPSYHLKCSFQNGVNIYNYGLANGLTATDCMSLGTETQNYLTKKIDFAPNPFQTELTISTTISLKNSTLKMYNSIGQIVKEISDINGHEINLKRENLNSGIYLIQLLENGNLIAFNKVIVAN